MTSKDPDEIVTLKPDEWRSQRKKPREPFFGPEWPSALAYVIGFAVVFSVSYWLRH